MATNRETPVRVTIPARYARAAFVKRGRKVRVINTHGTQVVDCWAFNAQHTAEFMSMEHCRVSFERYRPRRGDTMVTNLRRPILKILHDTANGAHDTLLAAWNSTGNPIYAQYWSNMVIDWVTHLPCRAGVARDGWNATGTSAPCALTSPSPPHYDPPACDRYRYEQLGCKEYHRNCTDNLWEAMIGIGYKITETPSPFNLWQNTPVEPDDTIKPKPPDYKKGDYIVMRAEMDLVICLSACPQDITSINANKPRNAHFEVRA